MLRITQNKDEITIRGTAEDFNELMYLISETLDHECNFTKTIYSQDFEQQQTITIQVSEKEEKKEDEDFLEGMEEGGV